MAQPLPGGSSDRDGSTNASNSSAPDGEMAADYDVIVVGSGFGGSVAALRLKDVIVTAGAGVGGGSLVYANVMYRPPKPFYTARQWAHITDWESELAPYYDQASRMLGVVTNPT